MSGRGLAALLVITAGLLAYILLFERNQMSTDQKAERAARLLPQVLEDELYKVELFEEDQPDPLWVLEKREGEWVCVNGDETFAVDDTVTTDWLLLFQYARPVRRFDIDADRELADFGLEPPRLRTSWHTPRGISVLRLGSEDTRHRGGAYAYVDGSAQAMVVEKAVVEAFSYRAEAFAAPVDAGVGVDRWLEDAGLSNPDE